MSILDLVQPKDLSRIAMLQVFARDAVEGFQNGRHRSPHKGFGVEFKEHRPYVRGDDLRAIDWKIYGKSDRLFIRQYEEETNLRCQLVVDISGSMAYRGERAGEFSKSDYATRLAACLSYLMLGQQDGVGLITFDSKPRDVVPPLSRPSQLKAVLAALAKPNRNRETDLGQAFRMVAAKLKRRGLVVILSDAMGDIESLNRAFAQLRASQNEVIFFQILDPDEVDFPFKGRIQFRSLEDINDQQMVEAASIRDRYLDRFRVHNEGLQSICRKHRVDLVTLATDEPFAEGLAHYVARRRRPR